MKGVICHGKYRRSSQNKPFSEATFRLAKKETKSTFYRHLESNKNTTKKGVLNKERIY